MPSTGDTGLCHAFGSRGKSEPLGTANSMKCVVAWSIIVQLKRYLVRARARARARARVRVRVRGRVRVRVRARVWGEGEGED